jgi:hypothetical protein
MSPDIVQLQQLQIKEQPSTSASPSTTASLVNNRTQTSGFVSQTLDLRK